MREQGHPVGEYHSRERDMFDDIVLPAGATITCENGHYICCTNHELVASAARPIVKSAWFENFAPQVRPPQPYDGADVCKCWCGAPWIDERPANNERGMAAKIHTDQGWWP